MEAADPVRDASLRRPLRVWPGVAAAALTWLTWLGSAFVPDGAVYGVIGGVALGAVSLLWWLFLSRAPWTERVLAIGVMVAVVAATSLAVHPSVSNGMMGMMLPVYSLPVLTTALAIWAALSRHRTPAQRRASMVAALAIAGAAFTLIRTGGVSGDGASDLHWRWTPTPEDRLLAQAADEPVPTPPASAVARAPAPTTAPTPSSGEPATSPMASPSAAPAREEGKKPVGAAERASASTSTAAKASVVAEWPGFRGPSRDGVVRHVRIDTDWSQKPPTEIWRRAIGPGWSSFAVQGEFIYTQEQRGQEESVSCYRLATGEPVWRHTDQIRFWESNAGAGPRGTPTWHNGRIYSMGATGVVNALDARTGALIWSRNAAKDTGKEIPDWGIASSPLVVDDLVIVAVAGQLAAYDIASGESRWMGEAGGGGYSSPHLATIDGIRQVVLLRGGRTISVAPADGTLLWEFRSDPAVSIVQPAFVAEHDVIITAGDAMGGLGMRRVGVSHGAGGWTTEERWLSRGLKPYFNDFVVHDGHAFGFDGSILAAIDLADGTRKWKGGRYGHGQLILLPDQDLLLVLSEDGELALVNATADKFTEVARVPALEGKTWNHPVLVGDTLLVRNGEQMAAFRLSLARP